MIEITIVDEEQEEEEEQDVTRLSEIRLRHLRIFGSRY